MKPVIDQTKCTGCSECVDDCPDDMLALDEDGKIVVSNNDCFECTFQWCVDVCTEDAIAITEN
jgi:NAD-dependent dihydropyrimidine dehydrogenase PreA subunit